VFLPRLIAEHRASVSLVRKKRTRRMAIVTLTALTCTALVASGCGHADADASRLKTETAAIAVTTATAVARPIAGFVSVSGTLTAQEDADVAAEVTGRVIATPVERGARVDSGASLVQIAATEAEAQATEAQANAAQIEARLGIVNGAPFDVERVPEVANAKAAFELAATEFERAETLRQRQLLSRAEYDQRAAQKTAAERQYDTARNGAAQQYQSLIAARARAVVAQKALADTVVRAPFAGVVGERFVSVGDYVTRGTKVASVLRIDPLRVQLTVTEQDVAAVAIGRPVTFDVDAYPGESFTGHIRYISPAVTADTRAMTVEAIVANPSGRLKPGFFATARIERAEQTPRIVVPAAAVRTVAGTARLFVLDGDRVKERVVTVGDTADGHIEVTSGLSADERVITTAASTLVDGIRVVAR
jgi:RND family efflux transporter MFP subunit